MDGIAGLKVLLLLYTYHTYAYPPFPSSTYPYPGIYYLEGGGYWAGAQGYIQV